MDELLLLRRVHEAVPEPSKLALDEGRAALLARAARTADLHAKPRASRRSRARSRWAGAGIGVVTGAALVTGLVAANVLGLAGWRGGAEP
ncbi:MAG TPA: hypothetical protein VIL55_16400, partial [Naasia sp.]